MNTRRKGTRNEHRSKALLEAAGYALCRSSASLGTWDLIGVGSTDVVLVQVKTNAWPGSVEMETLRILHRAADRAQAGASVARPTADAACDRDRMSWAHFWTEMAVACRCERLAGAIDRYRPSARRRWSGAERWR